MIVWAMGPGRNPGLLSFRQEAFTLGALASQFPRPADSFSFLARFPFGRLLEMVAALHLPEETLALHLFLQRFQRLVDVVVAHHDLNDVTLSQSQNSFDAPNSGQRRSRNPRFLFARDGRAALR